MIVVILDLCVKVLGGMFFRWSVVDGEAAPSCDASNDFPAHAVPTCTNLPKPTIGSRAAGTSLSNFTGVQKYRSLRAMLSASTMLKKGDRFEVNAHHLHQINNLMVVPCHPSCENRSISEP
jgi:hypothetical protein